MIFLIIQLSLITGLSWMFIAFIPSSYQTKRNQIVIGFIFCWLALINSMFSSHWINYTFDAPVLLETSQDLKLKNTSETYVSMELESNIQSTKIPLNPKELQPSIMGNISWLLIIRVLWLIGVIIFTYKWITQVNNIYKIRRQAQIIKDFNVEVKMYWSTISEVPFLYAGKTCFIIIPAHMKLWPKVNIKHIIKHEICHYQRKDHWVLWISVITKSVFWFHPFIHILAKKQQHYIELACDQQLLNNGTDPISYAETLLSCAQNRDNNQPVVAMASKPAQIKIRIKSVLNSNAKINQHRFKWLWLILSVPLSMTACINMDRIELVMPDQMIDLVSHDLKPLQSNQLKVGQIQLVAFYDGAIDQQTFVSIELKNSKNQISWLKLGPLKKFNEYIHTWQFSLKPDAYLTNRFEVQGSQPDGVVDGVALGLLIANSTGEVNGFQSKTSNPIGSKPNVVCAWPLGLLDEELIRALPQITVNNPDSVERIICGAQLVSDGTHVLQ